ncbi:LysR family transcriptional regulator [Catenovulum adriaticum]|uniref:LysR family transcriptional regulator n=1 Tax=Catenovulum adriaticum TaxID=2984846 RepID=A0ABY7AS07_9ALTE|nr:LysR family transcriptional regulator [Catenovulum sp. TS8]WAJ72322.1 LysR family transcriptional regulator [Catenovulum sp. TS8]
MINPVWLKTFCTLVEVGHFTQTAEKLFMTQSGVSQHIKKLEHQLEQALLQRSGKSFSLTDAGEKLYVKGQALLKAADELEGLIKQDEPNVGLVKLASPGSVGLKLYPHLLTVQQNHPKLIVDYRFAPNKNIEQDLIDRNIDLGLSTELSQTASLISQKIAAEPLVLVTSHQIEVVNWSTLLALGFISHPDAAHHARLLLSENFTQFEHIDQFIYKGFSNQISLILEPVSKGLGFTVLPLYAAKAFRHQNCIKIHLLEQTVSESLYLCFNRRSTLASRVKFVQSEIIDYLN